MDELTAEVVRSETTGGTLLCPRRWENTVKAFRCGDVVAGCTRSFQGSESSILAQVAEHARTAHGVVEVPQELVLQVRAAMTTA